jgi:SnoaL-like domain
MSPAALEGWLESYGRAWQARDPIVFSELFTATAEYYWEPFREPQRGRHAIASAVGAAFSGQSDVRFRFRLLTDSAAPYVAHWTCEFIRISTGRHTTVDGIFVMRFNDQGQCEEFREWWHSDEPKSGSVTTAPNE